MAARQHGLHDRRRRDRRVRPDGVDQQRAGPARLPTCSASWPTASWSARARRAPRATRRSTSRSSWSPAAAACPRRCAAPTRAACCWRPARTRPGSTRPARSSATRTCWCSARTASTWPRSSRRSSTAGSATSSARAARTCCATCSTRASPTRSTARSCRGWSPAPHSRITDGPPVDVPAAPAHARRGGRHPARALAHPLLGQCAIQRLVSTVRMTRTRSLPSVWLAPTSRHANAPRGMSLPAQSGTSA